MLIALLKFELCPVLTVKIKINKKNKEAQNKQSIEITK